MTSRVLGLGMLFISALPAAAGEPLNLRIRPSVAFAPAIVRVQVIVPPDAENRSLEVIADSPDFYRSSQVPLEGEQAAKTTIIEFRDLPIGTYEVTAVLDGPSGRRGMAKQMVTVVDRTGDAD